MRHLRPVVPLLAVLCLLQQHLAWADRLYPGGVVAAAYPEASRAALLMLDKGGNAVDAAVAAAFAAGVVGPYHNGVGGGGFALVYQAAARTTLALDFREVAPAGASRDMYLRDGKVVAELATDGALAVAVPAAAQGYLALLARAGSLKPSVVLAPAIRLAREGFLVTPKYQSLARQRVDCLAKDAEAARLFSVPARTGPRPCRRWGRGCASRSWPGRWNVWPSRARRPCRAAAWPSASPADGAGGRRRPHRRGLGPLPRALAGAALGQLPRPCAGGVSPAHRGRRHHPPGVGDAGSAAPLRAGPPWGGGPAPVH